MESPSTPTRSGDEPLPKGVDLSAQQLGIFPAIWKCRERITSFDRAKLRTYKDLSPRVPIPIQPATQDGLGKRQPILALLGQFPVASGHRKLSVMAVKRPQMKLLGVLN